MPKRIRMDTLEEQCRRRVDMARNQARNSAAFRALISEQYGALWEIVAEVVSRYFETSTTITATGASSYDEPATILHSMRIARVESDGSEVDLLELTPEEESAWKGRTGEACAFTHIDDQIYLYPAPSSGTYKLYYVAQATDLSSYADDDLVDVCCPAGLRFLVWGVAVLVHGELEGNAVLAMREREKAEDDLRKWAENLSLTEPHRRSPPVHEMLGGVGMRY